MLGRPACPSLALHLLNGNLGRGELTKALTVHAHKFSGKAAEKVAAAGGRTEAIPDGTKAVPDGTAKAEA